MVVLPDKPIASSQASVETVDSRNYLFSLRNSETSKFPSNELFSAPSDKNFRRNIVKPLSMYKHLRHQKFSEIPKKFFGANV